MDIIKTIFNFEFLVCAFYPCLLVPLLSWIITRNLSNFLNNFNINFNAKEKKTCRVLLATLLNAIYLTFVVFYFFARILGR